MKSNKWESNVPMIDTGSKNLMFKNIKSYAMIAIGGNDKHVTVVNEMTGKLYLHHFSQVYYNVIIPSMLIAFSSEEDGLNW